jgi:hypothetical protein
MTFKELKEKVALSYMEYLDFLSPDEQNEYVSVIFEADSVSQIVYILDGMGFNGDEAYEFIIESILE